MRRLTIAAQKFSMFLSATIATLFIYFDSLHLIFEIFIFLNAKDGEK